ncbi:MAG: hypothetical protein ABIJ46_04910, partial [bacterium]
ASGKRCGLIDYPAGRPGEVRMENYLRLIAATVVAVFFAGCAGATGVARFSASPETYRVFGVTTTPESMVGVAADANLRRYNAERYWDVVEGGGAYIHGGGPSGDFELYYGGPSGYVSPQVAPPEGYLPGGSYPATRDEVAAAQEQAEQAAAMAADNRQRLDHVGRSTRLLIQREQGQGQGGAR